MTLGVLKQPELQASKMVLSPHQVFVSCGSGIIPGRHPWHDCLAWLALAECHWSKGHTVRKLFSSQGIHDFILIKGNKDILEAHWCAGQGTWNANRELFTHRFLLVKITNASFTQPNTCQTLRPIIKQAINTRIRNAAKILTIVQWQGNSDPELNGEHDEDDHSNGQPNQEIWIVISRFEAHDC